MAVGLISPPLTKSSALGSLGGYLLVITCPSCGEKSVSVDKLISTPSAAYVTLKAFVPKLKCSKCGSAPIKIEAECDWIKRFRPIRLPRIDLSWLIAEKISASNDLPLTASR